MRNVQQDRVYRLLRPLAKWTADVAREAEFLADQALADDLTDVCGRLRAILEAAERNRYRTPSHRAW